MSKSIKHKLFFFTVPVYEREICVVVGMDHEEAVAAAKKQMCTKDFIQALKWERAVKLCNEVKNGTVEGAAIRVNPEGYFLFLKPYKNDWKYLDTLNHEIFHLSQFISRMLQMWDDREPPAYLHTYLFRQLRRILSGSDN